MLAYPRVMQPHGSLLREPLSNWFQSNDIPDVYESHRDALTFVYSSLSDPECPVGLVWSRGRPLSPSARLLRDCLRKVAQKHFEATDQRRQLSRPFGE